jgi:hypothetical protein
MKERNIARRYEGQGSVETGNGGLHEVEYRVEVEATSSGTVVCVVSAVITGPAEQIENLSGATGTLKLEGGMEIDGLFNPDGRIGVGMGTAVRGFSK